MKSLYKVSLILILFFCACKKNSKLEKAIIEDTPIALEKSVEDVTLSVNDNIYFVNAKSGLVVRDKPSTSGKKLTKLLYGSKVKVIENTEIALSIKDESLEINGHWVKIEHQIFQEAYVFNGFLQKNTDNLKAITFKVDQVTTATTKLREFAANKVYSKKINKVLFFKQEEKKELIYTSNNAFLQSFQDAYDMHRPLALSPDVVWLAIAQGFSIHMNENFKALESKVFKADKPKVITSFVNDLENNQLQWETLSNLLAKETAKYTNENIYSLLVPSFSTTGSIEQTAYHVNLLESFEQAFTYVGETGCGIPSITLEGTTADWLWIYNHILDFEKYGLKDWATGLKPILKEFVNASRGNVNTLFWQEAYKNASEYGGFYISGWVIKFFPYIVELGEVVAEPNDENLGLKTGKINVKNPFIQGDDYLMSTLSTDAFPPGVSQIDILLRNQLTNKQTKMEMYSGFLAIEQDENLALKPHIAYVVSKKNGEAVNIDIEHEFTSVSNDTYEYWCPYPIKDNDLKQKAVYNMRNNKTHEKGIEEVKVFLLNKIPKVVKGQKIRFTVLTNGTTTNEELYVGDDKFKKNEEIRKALKALPNEWFPAVAPIGVMELDLATEEEYKQLMKVHSIIQVQF